MILNLSSYKLVRADNLSNIKRGDVGIYFKKTLAFRPVPTNSLKECLLLEVFIGNKKTFVLSLYNSSVQSQEEFYDFFFTRPIPVKHNYLKLYFSFSNW